MILRFLPFAAAAVWMLPVCAQSAPSGWQVIKDTKQTCQIAVPGDWTTDKIMHSMASSPDKKSTAVIHGVRPGQSLAQVTSTAKQMMKPIQTFDDSSKRVWYSYESRGRQATHWYVAVPGNGNVCNADISFEDASFESTAKKIVESIGPAH